MSYYQTRPLADIPRDSEVGKTIPHESAIEHVTGRALYTDDLPPRHTGVLHAWPVQVHVAHARVEEIRTAAAAALPGVVKILTADDVPGFNDGGIKRDQPLFPSEVCMYGHPVAWVLGETEDAARKGAEAVEVDFTELPAILTPKEAIAAGSFQGSQPVLARGETDDAGRKGGEAGEVDFTALPAILTPKEAIAAGSFQGSQPVLARGDIESGFAEADHVFEGEFELGGQEHFYLETQASFAMVDEAGQIFIQSSTQHPSETQDIVAQVLGLSASEITVQCLRMGGGFGGKEMQPHWLAAVAALGARLTNRPVRLRLNRMQDMTMIGKRHGFHSTWRAGFTSDGKIVALDATLTADGGWSLELSEPVLARALCHIDNAYYVPNLQVAGRIAKTHKTSQTAFRGFGGPQGMLVR